MNSHNGSVIWIKPAGSHQLLYICLPAEINVGFFPLSESFCVSIYPVEVYHGISMTMVSLASAADGDLILVFSS